jgi:hypothetical protein
VLQRIASAAVSADETTLLREEWREGDRRLEAERGDRRRYETLLRQVGVVTDELRKRVGQTYTLAELASSYRSAEGWAREAVQEQSPSPGWPRDLALVLAAAYHAYQRRASDYRA